MPDDGRPTLLLAGTAGDIDRNYQQVDAALRERPGYRLVLATAPSNVDEMCRRYPHETVLPLPSPAIFAFWCGRLGVALLVGHARLKRGAIPFIDASAHVDADLLTASLRPLEWGAPKAGGTLLVDLLGARRIRSLAAFRARLGTPSTIVCLGNGPSSEDERLAAFHEAALFRVNWTWQGRGRMAEPDAVFTADPDLPGEGKAAILVFPTAAAGVRNLRRHAMLLRSARRGYVFLDRFEPQVADLARPVIPTNGALMIVIAAALEPERIVIAGMDLYRHPAGRYPGDSVAVDGYGRDHSAEVDLALIGSALKAFRGGVVNLSDNLASALASG